MKSARGKCEKSVLATLGLEAYIQVLPQSLIVPDVLSKCFLKGCFTLALTLPPSSCVPDHVWRVCQHSSVQWLQLLCREHMDSQSWNLCPNPPRPWLNMRVFSQSSSTYIRNRHSPLPWYLHWSHSYLWLLLSSISGQAAGSIIEVGEMLISTMMVWSLFLFFDYQTLIRHLDVSWKWREGMHHWQYRRECSSDQWSSYWCCMVSNICIIILL